MLYWSDCTDKNVFVVNRSNKTLRKTDHNTRRTLNGVQTSLTPNFLCADTTLPYHPMLSHLLGMGLQGPHPGAGAWGKAPGGLALAHGAWLGCPVLRWMRACAYGTTFQCAWPSFRCQLTANSLFISVYLGFCSFHLFVLFSIFLLGFSVLLSPLFYGPTLL